MLESPLFVLAFFLVSVLGYRAARRLLSGRHRSPSTAIATLSDADLEALRRSLDPSVASPTPRHLALLVVEEEIRRRLIVKG
jgi:hypothetical protein